MGSRRCIEWSKCQFASNIIQYSHYTNVVQDLLLHFVEDVLEAYASYTSANIAQDTFKLSFPRFVMPGPPPLAGRSDAAADAWVRTYPPLPGT